MKPHSYQKMNNTTDFKNHLRSEGYSQNTIRFHEQVIRALQQWTDQEGITTIQATYQDLLAWLQYKQKQGTGKAGASRYVNALKNYYQWLKETGKIETNPTQTIKLQGLTRHKTYDILSPLELNNLYSKLTQKQYRDSEKQNRDLALIGLVIFQGLSSTDLQQLRPQDLQLRAGTIEVPSSRRINERTLTLQPVQIMDLYTYVNTTRSQLIKRLNHDPETLFFTTEGSSRFYLLLESIRKKIMKAEARVRNLNQLRASVITHWIRTHNLRKAQYMAGHKYISSTEKYIIHDLEGLQEEVQQYHPLG